MSHLQFFNYPGFGERSKKDVNYSQAVRIDNRIEISGQGGWDPTTEKFPAALSDEIDQAFANVNLALQTAGGKGWGRVYKIRVYFAVRGEDDWPQYAEHLVRNLKKYCPNHGPLMTTVEVKALFNDMRIEIEAEEHLG